MGPFNLSGHDPGRITWTNLWLHRMLQVAYDIPADRISGPDWLDTERYNIVATIPMGTSVSDFRLMVQNLLAERFKLTTHRGTREVSGYVLEIAKSGLKIEESGKAFKDDAKPDSKRDETVKLSSALNSIAIVDQSGFPAPRPGNPYFPPGAGFEMTIAVNGRYRATVLNHPMAAIAAYLGNVIGSPVADQTGLAGIYDFHLEYSPGPPAATGNGDAPAAAASDPAPGIFDAIQAQLGLKLTPKKVPVETLVIDHAEKTPTEN